MKNDLHKLRDERVSLKVVRSSGKIAAFVGRLAGKSEKVATLEEIEKAAAEGWAGDSCAGSPMPDGIPTAATRGLC